MTSDFSESVIPALARLFFLSRHIARLQSIVIELLDLSEVSPTIAMIWSSALRQLSRWSPADFPVVSQRMTVVLVCLRLLACS